MKLPPKNTRILIKPDNTVLTDWGSADLEEGCLFQYAAGGVVKKCLSYNPYNGIFSWANTNDEEDIKRVQTMRMLMS